MKSFALSIVGLLLMAGFCVAEATPFLLELSPSTYWSSISLSHSQLPHNYSFSLSYKGDVLPYLYYGQDNKVIEAAYGAVRDFSFENQLFNHADIPSGIWLKSTLKPVSLKFVGLPNTNYLSAMIQDHLGLSFLQEESTSASTKRGTVSVFGHYSDSSFNFFSAYHTTSSFGSGYLISVQLRVPITSSQDFIGIGKWNWNGLSFNPKYSATYPIRFYNDLDALRNKGSLDDWIFQVSSKYKIEMAQLEIEGKKFASSNLYLVALHLTTPLDTQADGNLEVYQSSQETLPTFIATLHFKSIGNL